MPDDDQQSPAVPHVPAPSSPRAGDGRDTLRSFFPIIIVVVGFLLGIGLLLTAIILDFQQ